MSAVTELDWDSVARRAVAVVTDRLPPELVLNP